MTSSNSSSLQATSAVPAFVSNERLRSSNFRKQSRGRGLSDCCYSISNLALIVASIVAIIFTVKFFNDDPLYEIGDYLLTLRFYRQLVYIIVILPLILLVPLFNATSAFFLSENSKQEIGKSLLRVRIIYQVLLVILVFIALVFIAPSIRASSVATQIDFEIRKHIYRRYDNQFSFEFLDRIQLKYQCCDVNYYRSNFQDKLPLSCFVQDGFYSNVYRNTCSEVLGYMVSNRCMIITICFIIILFALASLIAMDVIELVNLYSGKNYDVWEQESKRVVSAADESSDRNNSPTNFNGRLNNNNTEDNYDSEDNDNDNISALSRSLDNVDILTPDEISNRLKLHERVRESPLLPPKPKFNNNNNNNNNIQTQNRTTNEKRVYSNSNSNSNYNDRDLNIKRNPSSTYSISSKTTSPILTRANYLNNYNNHLRAQSPMFISNGHLNDNNNDNSSTLLSQTPAKSVLKKSTSFSRIDTEEEQEEDENEVQNYQRQLQRELQTRRSLLSVRFAE